MISKMFAIYDSKAESYNAPFCFGAVGQAVRAFADLANDQQSNIAKHPADYNLFEVGTYDDQIGIVEAVTHINLGCALTFVDQYEVTGAGAAALAVEKGISH